jgi:hypothetical protein
VVGGRSDPRSEILVPRSDPERSVNLGRVRQPGPTGVCSCRRQRRLLLKTRGPEVGPQKCLFRHGGREPTYACVRMNMTVTFAPKLLEGV